mmetsp:Transcript_32677/g.69635  ORF Transcript_32677/g.69635 Transcript_32677/m.69635 type:complete len:103 (+) Transcript_32677:755-1063(+)
MATLHHSKPDLASGCSLGRAYNEPSPTGTPTAKPPSKWLSNTNGDAKRTAAQHNWCATQSVVPHDRSHGTNAAPHHGGATNMATPPHGGAAQSATPPLGRAT